MLLWRSEFQLEALVSHILIRKVLRSTEGANQPEPGAKPSKIGIGLNKKPALIAERGSWSVSNWLSRPLHVRRFGAAHNQLPAKELFIMEFLDGAAGFFNSRHLDKSESF